MAEAGDLRVFIREILLRHERVWREQREESREERAVLRGMLAEMQAMRKANEADHRAQLDALMHILDRLQNGGAAA